MSVQRFDALIVGGGPAGSTCAWRLRQANWNVLVLDKAMFPRDKPCAGWVTPPVVQSLQLDIEAYRDGRTWQPIEGFRCGLIGQSGVDVLYDRTISYGIRRREFDEFLLSRSGARVIQCRVDSMVREQDGWCINQEFAAPVLIGAGGNFCPVAKMLGAQSKEHAGSLVLAQEVEFQVADDQSKRVRVHPSIPELYFCKDLQGYGWCFRKQGVLNIGLGRVAERNLSEHVTSFCDFLRATGRVQCDLPRRFPGHAYRLYDSRKIVPVSDGVLLVGDSAGLAYSLSGEGIRPAVESGLMAADVILQADGDYCQGSLAVYECRLHQRFGETGAPSWAARLPAAWLANLAARLLTSRWFSRHVVMDRWFLRTAERSLG